MAREMNSLFMANPPIESQHRRAIFSLQDFPPISAQVNYGSNPAPSYDPEPRMRNYQSSYHQQGYQANYMGQMHMPIEPQTNLQGYGTLTWLSSKGGLITTSDKKVISFQTKEFGLEQQHDLLQYLRVGFTLKFIATYTDDNQYTASQVSPIYGEEADRVFKNSTEIDLEAANPTPPNSKDAYSLALEHNAYQALLGTFERQGMHKVQLSSLHSQMSNFGDDKLFRYVGSSSMKRRQFVERRTHIFCLQNDDSITLQYPAVYQLVSLLCGYILRRGGIASIQCLYNFYTSPEVPQSIKDFLGFDQQVFMNLLMTHNFAFALFPNRAYVSARRNLPSYDYIAFIKQFFPALMNSQQCNGFSQQHVHRTVSLPMRDSYGRVQHQNYPVQQRPQQYQAPPGGNAIIGGRTLSYTDSGITSPLTDDQWSSASNMGGWSSQASTIQTRQPSRANSITGLDLFNDNTLTSEFGNLHLLRQSDSRVSTGVQAEEIGKSGCTCKCTCGRGEKSADKSPESIASNAGAIGSSRGLPPILPGVHNLGSIGPIGSRPLSNSTASSDEQPKFVESYNLFGSNNVLSGSFDSLRFGNM